MEIIIYIVAGLIIGAIVGFLYAKLNSNSAIQHEKEAALQRYVTIEREFIAYKANAESQIYSLKNELTNKTGEIVGLNGNIESRYREILTVKQELATADANLKGAQELLLAKNQEIQGNKEELKALKQLLNENNQELASYKAGIESWIERFEIQKNELESVKKELKVSKEELKDSDQKLASAKANIDSLQDKLAREKKEIEELGRKFNTEFENIANKILDIKSEKFTELNKSNLKDILEPLGSNISEFRKKVEDVYEKESKERFSLGERVKELAALNQVISDEARNLTKALKGESKTQGRWGEMILESILEKSGLVKNREYFMEHELKDEDGTPLKSESEGKKMRPDAVIKYPDNRSVIIDSKVSLNAFSRMTEAANSEEQKLELQAHIQAIKNHITTLSGKGYDDYKHALDFVMLFVPSEAAYTAALQGDPELWNFAYDRRILLLSPTNLITSLKLIVDLWKREYQNKNAQAIAKEGAALYDKFVGFVANLKKVGDHLALAQDKYNESYKQLYTGNGNLIKQASELKNLGLKTKKELPQDMVTAAFNEDFPELINN